jgi:hypothetical protein
MSKLGYDHQFDWSFVSNWFVRSQNKMQLMQALLDHKINCLYIFFFFFVNGKGFILHLGAQYKPFLQEEPWKLNKLQINHIQGSPEFSATQHIS